MISHLERQDVVPHTVTYVFSFNVHSMLYIRPNTGWTWIIVFAAFVEKCISGYSIYCIGYFQIVLVEKYQDDTMVISWISAVFLTCHSMTDSGWAWVIVFAAFYEKCISGYSVYGVGLIQIVLMDKFPDDTLVISWISAMFMTCHSATASGWAWVIVFAAFYEKCISGYSVYGVGFIQIVLMDKFPDDALVISWISAMFMTCHSATGPIAGFIIDKWNCRVAMVTGSLLITISAIITAFTNNIVLVFIFFGLLGGTGIGLMYSTGYIVLAFNFVKKRNIVTGIAVSGCGIGPFILSPVFQIIHQQYGYTGFFLLYAGLNFNACVVGALLRTSELEVTSRIERQRKKALEKTNCCKCDVTVVKNIPLLFIGLAGTFLNMGISMIYLHFPIYAINNYSTEVQVAWFLSIAGICSCVSRILLGMATNTDVISDDVVFFGAYTLLGGVTLCLPLFITSHQAKIAYSVILGTYTGTCYVVINSIVLKLTGPDHVAQGIGYVIAYMGIGTFLGPPVAGFIIENGGSYDISFIIAGFSLILCGFLELGSVCFNTQRYTSPVTEYDYTIAKQENDIMFKQENDTTVTAKQENDTNAMTKQENNTIFKQENDKCIQNEDIRLISPSG